MHCFIWIYIICLLKFIPRGCPDFGEKKDSVCFPETGPHFGGLCMVLQFSPTDFNWDDLQY